ncbi:CvpA family protein [Patescibacteria group bacterium]|nr:CvpA family protein [Patescibacteria group bacterium]
MTLFNLVLLLLLLAFIGLGLKDGFIVALGRIVGAVIGFVAARAWYVAAAPLLTWLMPEGWAKIAMFLIIFVLVDRLMGWIFSALDKTYDFLAKIPFMKSANHLIGALVGLIEGIVVMGGVIWVIKTFKIIPFVVTYLDQSIIATAIYKVFLGLLGILL